MKGYAELIEAAPPGPAGGSRYADYARTLAEASRHMLSLVNDLLDQAKIEAGRIDLAEDEVTVAEAIDAACRVIAPHSRTLAVELVDGTEVDGTKLRADRRRLQQMLINLLSNAVKFTPAGGRVTVTSEPAPDGALRLKVADNGIGIEADDIGRILIPFERAAKHRRCTGTGLGLPITKQLIELHGGSLSISSDVGGGTTVTLRFPPERVVRQSPRA